jgi:hypothetical protein
LTGLTGYFLSHFSDENGIRQSAFRRSIN